MPAKPVDLRVVRSFGDVAAEEDAVSDYFLATPVYNRISSGDALLVLGRKGAGKTALVRHFNETKETTILSKALSFRAYPWAAHAARIDLGASPSEVYAASWQFFLALEACKLVFALAPDKSQQAAQRIQKFLKRNYGTETPESSDLLKPPQIRLEGSFEPQVFGSKLGSIKWVRAQGDFGLSTEIRAVSASLFTAASEIMTQQLDGDTLLLHLDELDQGLTTLDDQRRDMMIGLILAARSMKQHFRALNLSVSPVIYLRTDLWEELRFSDKNKIAATSALPIEWNEGQLKQLIEIRASVRLGAKVGWEDLEDGDNMRGSQPKWRHMAARTYLRPRDMIRFCNAALEILRRRENGPYVFTNQDIVSARDDYSAYLKNELDDEITPHWPEWNDALAALSAIQTLTFTAEDFHREYEERLRVGGLGSDDALARLFDFSVIGWERRSGYGGSGFVFKYESPESGWDRGAHRFKTHLGLKEYCRLKEERL